MPDAAGRIRPVRFPAYVPWCPVCKLVECACELERVDAVARERVEVPAAERALDIRAAAGGLPGYVGFEERRSPHHFATPVVHERRSSRLLS